MKATIGVFCLLAIALTAAPALAGGVTVVNNSTTHMCTANYSIFLFDHKQHRSLDCADVGKTVSQNELFQSVGNTILVTCVEKFHKRDATNGCNWTDNYRAGSYTVSGTWLPWRNFKATITNTQGNKISVTFSE